MPIIQVTEIVPDFSAPGKDEVTVEKPCFINLDLVRLMAIRAPGLTEVIFSDDHAIRVTETPAQIVACKG